MQGRATDRMCMPSMTNTSKVQPKYCLRYKKALQWSVQN